MTRHRSSFFLLIIKILCLLAFIEYCPLPSEALNPLGWKTFLIFMVTLTLLIQKIYDMGTVSFIAIALMSQTQVLSLEQILHKFSYPVTWLVLSAFFIAKGFILSGLGTRIALALSSKVGTTPLKLAYALSFAECLVAPFIPSNTARGGGLIVPVAISLGENIFGSPKSSEKKPQHGNAFLLYSCFQANLISSALFLTAMAGNPIIANFASDLGYELSWMRWFSGAVWPALICLMLGPWFLFHYLKVETPREEESLKYKVSQAYKALGPIKEQEIIMSFIFGFLLVTWIAGASLGIHPTAAALIAVTFLLVTRMVTWNDLATDHQAWTTFVWLTVLFTLTTAMKDYGFIQWLTQTMTAILPKMSPTYFFVVLCLFNFYSHYFFASLTSHITTIVQPLLLIGFQMGVPLQPLILGLAYTTALSGGLTHYGTGSGSITYGYGYWNLRQWWSLGFINGTLILIIFVTMGLFLWF